MDRLIYTAMSGARSLVARQDHLAQNLANVSTPGYRAETFALRAVPAGSGPSRAFSQETSTGSDFTPGPIQRTGRSLDVAVEGRGWIAVQGRDGQEAYTRSGSLRLDPNGAILSPGGMPVMGDGGPLVAPPDTTLEIARDGTISAIPNSGSRSAVVSVGRIKLVNPEDAALVRGEDGLFRLRSGEAAGADPAVTLATGAVEGSNVNPVEAMVGMISAARSFETQMKLLTTAEANARAASQLLSVGN